MNPIKIFLIPIILMLILIGCANKNPQPINTSKSANLIQPFLVIKTTGYFPKIELPLLVWPSFEYRKINAKPGWSQGGGKENFCVINESDGIPIKIETPIEFLEDATCFYTFFTSLDGMPHKYIVGLVKIKILSTNQEVWTWGKAVEIKK